MMATCVLSHSRCTILNEVNYLSSGTPRDGVLRARSRLNFALNPNLLSTSSQFILPKLRHSHSRSTNSNPSRATPSYTTFATPLHPHTPLYPLHSLSLHSTHATPSYSILPSSPPTHSTLPMPLPLTPSFPVHPLLLEF